jgi:hypothetical protein
LFSKKYCPKFLNSFKALSVPGKEKIKKRKSTKCLVFGLWCLTPLSTIFQLYHGGQFYRWRKPPTCRKSLTNDNHIDEDGSTPFVLQCTQLKQFCS